MKSNKKNRVLIDYTLYNEKCIETVTEKFC